MLSSCYGYLLILAIITIFDFSALLGLSGSEQQKQTSDFDLAGKNT